jgi:hypothetical protein
MGKAILKERFGMKILNFLKFSSSTKRFSVSALDEILIHFTPNQKTIEDNRCR